MSRTTKPYATGNRQPVADRRPETPRRHRLEMVVGGVSALAIGAVLGLTLDRSPAAEPVECAPKQHVDTDFLTTAQEQLRLAHSRLDPYDVANAMSQQNQELTGNEIADPSTEVQVCIGENSGDATVQVFPLEGKA